MDKSTAFMRQLQKNLFDVAFNCWGDFFTEVSDTLQVMCSDKCLLSYLLARWNQVNFTLKQPPSLSITNGLQTHFDLPSIVFFFKEEQCKLLLLGRIKSVWPFVMRAQLTSNYDTWAEFSWLSCIFFLRNTDQYLLTARNKISMFLWCSYLYNATHVHFLYISSRGRVYFGS